MIIIISGASHTGKIMLAQRLLCKYNYPYLSIDLLKMGLIRSGNTQLTPYDDSCLEQYLWPIIREMIKTAIENHQNLIVEGAYVPFNWKTAFTKDYLDNISYYCIIMSENYITEHFEDIKKYANIIEQRLNDSQFTMEQALHENTYFLRMCKENNCNFVLIKDVYTTHIDFLEKQMIKI